MLHHAIFMKVIGIGLFTCLKWRISGNSDFRCVCFLQSELKSLNAWFKLWIYAWMTFSRIWVTLQITFSISLSMLKISYVLKYSWSCFSELMLRSMFAGVIRKYGESSGYHSFEVRISVFESGFKWN